ncbi:MAG: hypothetical protein KIS78_25165 [Labilithrix sp.]|nr:hypothetical protein [Labilithrix sp.]MCW5835715.1 hypothetical protein [Labilithrix sp.]
MKFTYRLIRDKDGFVAECVESEAAGEGKTAKDAVESLRRSLEERMFRPDAVAPPSQPPRGVIELTLADEGAPADRRSLDPGGPGDAPLR